MDKAALNELPIDTIQQTLGDQAWRKIEELTTFLFSPKLLPKRNDPCWRDKMPRHGRFASSIVTRSEIEVLGISMPRFCYRLYFEGVESFLNIRRLDIFQSELLADPEIMRGTRFPDLGSEEQHPRIISQGGNMDLQELMATKVSGFVIADCLLKPPSRFPEHWYHLTMANLYREYGELGERRKVL